MNKRFFWIILAMLACFTAPGIIYTWRDVLLAPVIKKIVITTAKRQLGVDLAIQHLGGNYITALDIQQVQTLHANPEGPVVSLSFTHLRLRYSLFDLFWQDFL